MVSSVAPDTLVKLKAAYDAKDESGEHVYKTWREILEAAGLVYEQARASFYRRQLEEFYQQPHPSPTGHCHRKTTLPYGTQTKQYDGSLQLVVISDCHWWSRHRVEPSQAYRFLLHVLRQLEGQRILFVINGDAFDGASISRFPKNGWEQRPTVREEIDACIEYTDEIDEYLNKCDVVDRLWVWGNHDLRFDKLLANKTPEIDGMKYTSLADYFAQYQFMQSCLINDNVYLVHAFKGGKHAPYNDALHAGVNIITGHSHANHQRPITNIKGMHFGVKCGSLANVNSDPQFAYHAGGVGDQQSGFVTGVIDGDTFACENVIVRPNGKIYWRGNLYNESDYI